MPLFEAVPGIAPAANFRADGMKIPRQPHRYSGRTSMHANVSVHEPKPTDDQDSALSFSMEGYGGQPPGAIIPRYWSPGWNSVQALNKFQSEVGGPLRGGDPGLRLIEPSQVQPASYFHEVPEAFQRRKGEWLVVPIYHIFGSEELSAIAPAIAERVPKPCLWLNDEDAADLHVGLGWEVRLDLDQQISASHRETRSFFAQRHCRLSCGLSGVGMGRSSLMGLKCGVSGRAKSERKLI